MPRSFNNLARCYRALERISFGNQLTRARLDTISSLPIEPGRVLLLGDGDGRFCCELLTRFENAKVVSLDSSHAMLDLARQRIERCNLNPQRVEFIEEDIRKYELPKNEYDFIGLNFILDCFRFDEIEYLIPKIESALKPSGYIGYADFNIPEKPFFKRVFAKTIIALLYLFFRATTDISANKLPVIQWSEDNRILEKKLRLGGLLVSELRQITL